MARRLPIEYEGAFCHVTSRGNDRKWKRRERAKGVVISSTGERTSYKIALRFYVTRPPARRAYAPEGFAGDYVAMGENIEEKQEYLNGAVSAWNIACLDEEGRKRAIKKYMKKYRKLNPTHSKQDLRDVEEDLRLLIKQKENLYPEVRVQIVNAHIQEIDGKDHVTVMSLSVE